MPNIVNQELVKAFNIILCHNEIAITNFTVQNVRQSLRNKDHIVILFDKSMDADQCMKYLDNMKGRIVETFCGNESTASLSFDMKSFPFNFNRSQLVDSNGKYRFSVPIDQSIVFNLKCLLANGLARDITGAMGRDFGLEHVEGYTSDEIFDRKSYLYCMRFYDKRLQEYFIESFSATVKGYKNSPKRTDDFLKVKDNCVYIKASIFDDVKFIKNIIKHKASLECRDFEVPSSEDENVENLKFPIIALLRRMGIPADTILHTSYTGSGENSVLVPIIQMTSDIGGKENCRLLNKEEVNYVNRAFGMDVLRNVQDYTSPKHLPVFGNGGVYGIDFYDKDISYCVLNKIVESSVINKRHELAIDPELHFRALSPAHSPVEVPNRYLNEAQLEYPTRSQGEELGRPPGRGFIGAHSGLVSVDQVDIPGTSEGFSPRSHLSSPVTNPHSSKCVGAAQTVPAGTSAWSQPIGFWSSPAPSAEPSLWQPSRPLSRKGANESGSAWTSQPIGFWSSPASSAGFSSWSQSGPSSWKGANPVGANPCLSQGTSENKKSESPKKHWSRAIPNEILSFLKRNNKERNSISSSRSTPAISVTKKPPLSERSASERKAKSNPPSKVTSPTHEGVPGGLKLQQCLTSGQSKELYKVLSPEMKKKLDSGSLPLGYEKLLYLLYVDKRELRLLLSEPKAKEQMCSVLPLPPEKMEQVQSSSPEEVLSLLHTFFNNQKISDNFLISSRVDSPNIKKHLQEEKEVFI
ncbi:MAG: hypothetical protein ACEY3F_08055 [Wolbachia sp.]